MRIRSRRTAWVLVVFALLFLLASAFFPAMACHHHCTGDDCPVCMQVRVWTFVLRLFGAGALCALLRLAAQVVASYLRRARTGVCMRRTPVSLKTKLLN